MFQLNFDGASKGNPGKAGFGGIFRDHKGVTLLTFLGWKGWDSNNSAELEGLWKGLLLAHSHDFFPLIIEGDSQILINMMNKMMQGTPSSKIGNSWRLAERLELVEDWLRAHRAVNFKHIHQEGNKVQNLLANIRVESKLKKQEATQMLVTHYGNNAFTEGWWRGDGPLVRWRPSPYHPQAPSRLSTSCIQYRSESVKRYSLLVYGVTSFHSCTFSPALLHLSAQAYEPSLRTTIGCRCWIICCADFGNGFHHSHSALCILISTQNYPVSPHIPFASAPSLIIPPVTAPVACSASDIIMFRHRMRSHRGGTRGGSSCPLVERATSSPSPKLHHPPILGEGRYPNTRRGHG